MNDIRFGLNVSPNAAPGADPVRDALMAEDAGFDFVSASDHPSGTEPSYESWTMLSWIAAATHRISVATRVMSVPFRAPGLIAKMAETLDRLSGGRVILGLGGGATDGELRAFGLPVPSPAEKVVGLADAVTIIRGLWSESALTYHGAVYETESAPLEPKPAHLIPIWLGTFGPRALAITGRLTDGWIPSLGYRPTEELPMMLKQVLEAAEAAGRKRSDVTCALNMRVCIDDRPSEPDTDVVAGPADQVTEQLLGFAAAGFTTFSIFPIGSDRRRQIERLASDVIPLVRANA